MRHTLAFAALASLAISLAPVPAAANGVSQLRESLRHDIRLYYPEADVDALSAGQLAQIHVIVHSQRSESDKRMLVRSALGRQGPGTLRDLFLD